ncbi:hypothetical protein MKX01_028672 [Papaver californicum]|nr:hypothetical protein MKX01_028672 [Papaver californicum]
MERAEKEEVVEKSELDISNLKRLPEGCISDILYLTSPADLEKCSGKKCIMLGAKELAIAWGDTPRYWYWLGYPGSRFAKVAELKWVCWLEIRGKLDTRLLSPKTFYAAYLAKVEVVGRTGDNSSVCSEERRIYLVEMGHFYNGGDNEGGEVLMPVLETERLGAKYGIIVQGMELRPKVDTQIP